MPMATHAPLRRGLSIVAALALASSSVALAAPAVTTRSTSARSAPFKVAPVVQELESGANVSADEAPTNGWRRIELPGGKFAYVPDGDVKIDPTWVKPAAPKPEPVVAAPPAPAAPAPAAEADSPTGSVPQIVQPLGPSGPMVRDGRTVQYVTDLSHLTELVKSDPEALALAEGIATRRGAAVVFVWGGVLGGLVLRVLAVTALQNETCTFLPTGSQLCIESDNTKLKDIGLAVMALGPLIGAALWPTRADQTRVINTWNLNHPRRPMIDGSGVEIP